MPTPAAGLLPGTVLAGERMHEGDVRVCVACNKQALRTPFEDTAPFYGGWWCQKCIERDMALRGEATTEREWLNMADDSQWGAVSATIPPVPPLYRAGLEFEVFHRYHVTDRCYDLAGAWEVAACGLSEDGSIESDAGLEIKTPPALGELADWWVRGVCRTAKAYGMVVDKSCGLHVHLELPEQGRAPLLRNLLLIAKAFEPIIFGMLPGSRWNNNYTSAIKLGVGDLRPCRSAVAIRRVWGHPKNGGTTRYKGINLEAINKYGTVEFRYHSGTVNEEKALAWLRICRAMFQTAHQCQMSDIPAAFTTRAERLNLLLPFLGLSDLRGYIEERTALFGHNTDQLERWAQSLDVAPVIAPFPQPESEQDDENAREPEDTCGDCAENPCSCEPQGCPGCGSGFDCPTCGGCDHPSCACRCS